MSEVRPPIVIAEEWDVSLHGSVEAVAQFLEPPDVARGIYEIYDAEGRLLRATTDGKVVRVELADEAPQHRARLVQLLKGFCDRVHVAIRPDAELGDLIQACVNVGFLLEPSPGALRFFKDWLRMRVSKKDNG